MKIFLIVPTLAAGGAERVMSLLANNWGAKKGLDVHLILLAEAKDFYAIDSRVTIHRLGFTTHQNAVHKIFGVLRVFFLLRKLVKKEKPHFLLSFMNKYNIIALASCVATNSRVFVSERDSSTVVHSWQVKWLRRVMYPMAAGIIAQTENYKQFIQQETGNCNVCVIPNPVRAISKPQDTVVTRELIILNIGRLVSEKGQLYLLDAFAKLNDAECWRLVILGDGPLRGVLQKHAEDLGVANRVDFKGAVKDVDEWLNKSSVFAFSSISEGFPNALAEAMSAGLPCVSFDCVAGPRDLIIDTVNGFLVDSANIELFAARLNDLIKSDVLRKRISEEAEKTSKKLSSQKICAEYLDFITKV